MKKRKLILQTKKLIIEPFQPRKKKKQLNELRLRDNEKEKINKKPSKAAPDTETSSFILFRR